MPNPNAVPGLAVVNDQVYGRYETSVLRSSILRFDLVESDNYRPFVNGFNANEISIYPTLDMVADYTDVVPGAGERQNAERTPVAYGAFNVVLTQAIDPAIKVGSFIQTQHNPNWWRATITAISADRKTLTVADGWFKKGETTPTTPTGTTKLWVNAMTRAWVLNSNLFLQPGGPVDSGQAAEIGVINNRGPYAPPADGGLIGNNDASGYDIVSFGTFRARRAVRARGNFDLGFEVHGMPGASAFRVTNSSGNPMYGFDWRADTGLPIYVAPFLNGSGDPIESYSVQLDGSVNMGRRLGAAPVSQNFFTSGSNGSPDAQLLVNGGDGSGFGGVARWRQNAMSFEGKDGTEQVRILTALGSLTRISMYGSGPAGPARIVAERIDGSSSPANLSLEATNGGRIRVTAEMFKNTPDLKITARNSGNADIGLNIAPAGTNAIVPTADGALSLGTAGARWQKVVTGLVEYGNGVQDLAGAGSPNTLGVPGSKGWTYRNAGSGASFWTHNGTAWVAMATA